MYPSPSLPLSLYRYLVAGNHKFVFLVKGPLILVAVSRTGEPVSQLIQQLTYVHSQIISILTAGVNQIFEKRAHFDLRSLLGGNSISILYIYIYLSRPYLSYLPILFPTLSYRLLNYLIGYLPPSPSLSLAFSISISL